MPSSITVNSPRTTLVHKGSGGYAKNTVPDVCKTPSPGGPVPVPYPVIISLSSNLAKGTITVKADGGKMCANKGSQFSRCSGDEAGTAGGVKSGTNMRESAWILYSFDVKIEGKNACRKSDKMTMNHANTLCMSGEDEFARGPGGARKHKPGAGHDRKSAVQHKKRFQKKAAKKREDAAVAEEEAKKIWDGLTDQQKKLLPDLNPANIKF